MKGKLVHFPCRSKIAALVIVLMALSSAAPLAYTHQHEATVCHDEHDHADHAHSHCHRHCHAQPESHPVAALLSPHVHEHVFWWGFEFVVPADTTNGSGDSPSTLNAGKLGVLSGRTNTATVDLAPAPLPIFAFATIALGGEPIVATSSHDDGPAIRQESNLLCDTARFERSGVQQL